jgi:hypothetical protein
MSGSLMYLSLTHDAGGADGMATALSRSSIADYRLTNPQRPQLVELRRALPPDRAGGLKANTDGAALIDKGALGGNSPDHVCRPISALSCTRLETRPGPGLRKESLESCVRI